MDPESGPTGARTVWLNWRNCKICQKEAVNWSSLRHYSLLITAYSDCSSTSTALYGPFLQTWEEDGASILSLEMTLDVVNHRWILLSMVPGSGLSTWREAQTQAVEIQTPGVASWGSKLPRTYHIYL